MTVCSGVFEVGGGDGGFGDESRPTSEVGLWLRARSAGGVGFELGEFGAELFGGLVAEVVDLVGGEAEDGGHRTLSGGDGPAA